jgi:outer membrane protein TolC
MLIGVPLSTDIEIADVLDLEENISEQNTGNLVATAYEKRPELGVAKASLSIAKEKIDIASADLWPKLGMRFSYIYSRPNQLYFPPQDETNGSWDFSLFLNWTVWDWGTTFNGRRAAKAEASAAHHALEEIKNNVRMDVQMKASAYKTAAQKIASAKSSIVSAKRAFENAKMLFEAGRLTSLDLLNAELQLTQTNYKLVQALADARIAWIRVQKAAGTLIAKQQ